MAHSRRPAPANHGEWAWPRRIGLVALGGGLVAIVNFPRVEFAAGGGMP